MRDDQSFRAPGVVRGQRYGSRTRPHGGCPHHGPRDRGRDIPGNSHPVGDARQYGESLARARQAAELTQQELGQRLGIRGGGNHVSRWERGIHRPRPDMVARLAAILGDEVVAEAADSALRRRRLAAGLTLAQAAQASGIPPATLGRVETGRNARRLTDDELARLARALHTSPAALASGIPALER